MLPAEEKKANRARRLPIRNLENNRLVKDYLAKHSVYASMTSSPDRLGKCGIVVSNILVNPYIKKFFVNLPEKYRNKESYRREDVEKLKKLDCRIEIRWIREDIGPISKILPSLQAIQDNLAIVMSFDDDVFYPPSLINELIYYSIRYPKIICGGAGFSFGDMENIIDRKNWPEKRKPRFPDVDVIEGWGGVAYRKGLMDLKLIERLNKLSTVCKLSDDIVISYSLAKARIKRKVISNKFYTGNRDVFPLSYGLGEGALHQGSGTGGVEEGADANMEKYRDCLEKINSNRYS